MSPLTYVLSLAQVQVYLSLALLFGIASQFRRMGGHGFLTYLLDRIGSYTGTLFAIIILTSLLSPFILNDVLILILTPVIASSTKAAPWLVVGEIVFTNISSSASPFGNPQNILLWEASGLTPGQFITVAGPPLLLSGLIAAAVLLAFPRGTIIRSENQNPDFYPGIYLLLAGSSILVLGALRFPPYLSLAVAFFSGFAFRPAGIGRLAKEFDVRGILILYALITSVSLASGVFFSIIGKYTQPAADLKEPYSAVFMIVVSNVLSNVPATQLILSTARVHAANAPLIAVQAGLAGNFDPISSLANLLALLILRRNKVGILKPSLLLLGVGIVSSIPMFFLPLRL